MNQEAVEYVVRVHEAEDGSLWAEVLDLPGCFATGDTLDELREALQEAISLYVSDDPNAGRGLEMVSRLDDAAPRAEMRVKEMRVRVPA